LRITADTNVLVRAIVDDAPEQAQAARNLLASADLVVVTLPTLCEFAWVLTRAYRVTRPQLADCLKAVLETENIVADRMAAEAGIAMLEAGGDFADGVIASEGRRMGGETFASFDRQAVNLWDGPSLLVEA
jgi:predicted nucleic-acid-binding protein